MRNCITGLMIEDHERLIGLFDDFKKTEKKDLKKANELFARFDKELRNHFIAEEKIIISTFRKNNNTLPIVSVLKSEHIKIRSILEKILASIRENSKINTFDLFTVLTRHQNIEERLFYPELDEMLSEKEKNAVYEKIKNTQKK